ncbi:Uncharacterised protein [uncultured archaeon]|nr:Uncharacterised protein [uncultured archaeon]
MTKVKTSIALDDDLLKWVDSQIEKKRFANRTHAIEYALQQLKDGEDVESGKQKVHFRYAEQPYEGSVVAEKPSKK